MLIKVYSRGGSYWEAGEQGRESWFQFGGGLADFQNTTNSEQWRRKGGGDITNIVITV